MKILVDMNLSPKWVKLFTDNSIESVHWSSIGPPNDPDINLITYATENNFVIFTKDLDFGTFLAINRSKKPSIIQMKEGTLNHRKINNIVISAITMFADKIEAGAIVTIDQNKTRVSLLPL
ncbi:MAG: DUF5615 family PIN-like protein [Treponema sp.]|nr:DUF5615 family PIN-like protein [Treponema sp.]